MSLIVYVTILVVAVFSVAMEWGALVEPSGATLREMQAVSHFTAPVRPAAPVPRTAVSASETKQSVAVPTDTPRVVHPAPQESAVATAPVPDEAKPAVETAAAAANAAATAGDTAQAPQCDIAACSAAYHTFRPEDCTYQPSNGPRRLCSKGQAASAAASRVAADAADAALPSGTTCHYRSCAEHYSSFDPSTCTYQPLEGPRRLCER